MDDMRSRFDAEVLPHLDAAYRYARWLSRSPSDADDVVQEALLRAFRGLNALHGSNVKAWLLTIVRNCHWTALKQMQRRGFVPLPDEHCAEDGYAMISSVAGPEGAAMQRDAARTLDELIAVLPQDQREVLHLREIEEMDYREIAQMTEVPIGTVMSRLARARSALKVQWAHNNSGDADVVP